MADESKPESEKVVVPSVSSKDIEENKVFAVLAYIGILFLIPLLAAPKSPYAKFHANQGCVLFIAEVIVSFFVIIPILGWAIAFFGGIFGIVLSLMGIINALNGKTSKLPLIGDISIIK